jgi:hypothetical protein
MQAVTAMITEWPHGPVTVIKKPIEYEQLNKAVKQLGHKGAEHAN